MPFLPDFSKPVEEFKENRKPVKVIASFSLNGSIRPVYFEYEGRTVKIDKVRFTQPNSCFGILYYCDVIIHDHIKSIMLMYHFNGCRWTLDI